ncbi:probable cytosolic oligopeptidase A [Coccinella septempunctata]|uniref:probable cytosolic oligopeptidase A n=1 Tax=Coccinella septempunctata TaxID=41139 RepID=UPI001D07D172|nr:probable cytosolic oligopeptidase A [Coccinella septempunctata]
MALISAGRRIINSRNLLISHPRNIGYIVLLPEIGDVSTKDQPLLKDNLPEFNNVTIENCTALIAKQALEFESEVKRIEKEIECGNVNIEKDVIEPLEISSAPLNLTWGISKTLYLGNKTGVPTKTYLPIHERARQARSAKYNSPKIYGAIKKEISEGNDHEPELKRVLEKFHIEGKLNGLDLSDDKKEVLKRSLVRLSKEKQIFKQKIEQQTDNFSHTIQNYQNVRDFPEDLLKAISVDSSNYLRGPWKVTLQPSIYSQTMQYCPDREIRWNLWQGSVNRGSGFLEKDKFTGLHLEEIRNRRQEIAQLLGYKTFADMSMETKMAGSVENVRNMINNLLEKAKPAQNEELKQLFKFATENGFEYSKLELWDVPYWRKRQQLSEYKFNPENYKKYFPFPTVLEGMFKLCEKLFGVVIKQRNDVSTWNKDVKFYDILESHSSAPVAGFYLDSYREKDNELHNINSNGWMVAIQNKSSACNRIPLASLIFNFEPLKNGKPPYLDVDSVYSLFYRFGLALQHLLTRASFEEVSGLSNIEWDMVEVCGHVFTHFLHNKDVIESISCDLETGDKLPADLFKDMCDVKKHMAGSDLCRELYFSALDVELYSKEDHWLKITRNLWPQFIDFPLDKNDSHPCSFTQIFTEEWAAAYYSHIWSRVIAADIYSAFQEMEGNEQEFISVGKRFRETFLALGGSAHSTKIFRHFRGRDPCPKALLNNLGLSNGN